MAVGDVKLAIILLPNNDRLCFRRIPLRHVAKRAGHAVFVTAALELESLRVHVQLRRVEHEHAGGLVDALGCLLGLGREFREFALLLGRGKRIDLVRGVKSGLNGLGVRLRPPAGVFLERLPCVVVELFARSLVGFHLRKFFGRDFPSAPLAVNLVGFLAGRRHFARLNLHLG